MPRDMYHDHGEAFLVKPQTKTTSAFTAEAYADLALFEGALVEIIVGTLSAGPASLNFQESDTTTSGDFADIDPQYLCGVADHAVSVPTTAADSIIAFSYLGGKRYIRCVSTGSPTGSMAVVVIKGYPRYHRAAS